MGNSNIIIDNTNLLDLQATTVMTAPSNRLHDVAAPNMITTNTSIHCAMK